MPTDEQKMTADESKMHVRLDGWFKSEESADFTNLIASTIETIFENDDAVLAANYVSIKVDHYGKPYELILMRPEPGVETPADKARRLEMERDQLLALLNKGEKRAD